MLFKREFHAGLRSGAITRTVRRWAKPQVREGGRYKTAVGMLEVDHVERIRVSEVRAADARHSGFADRAALLAALAGSRGPLRASDTVYRVRFRFAGAQVDAPPANDTALRREDVEALGARLAKMDRLSRHGAWTRQTLDLIRTHPRTAASTLAERVGRETRPFKADVRKLKKLGLTRSFDVGYEISPRGRAFLRRCKGSRGS